MQREERGDDRRHVLARRGPGDCAELLALEGGLEPVAALHLHRRHAERRHSPEASDESSAQRVLGRRSDGAVGREDATAGPGDVAVVAAGHAHRVLGVPRSDPAGVRVRVDETRRDDAVAHVDDGRAGRRPRARTDVRDAVAVEEHRAASSRTPALRRRSPTRRAAKPRNVMRATLRAISSATARDSAPPTTLADAAVVQGPRCGARASPPCTRAMASLAPRPERGGPLGLARERLDRTLLLLVAPAHEQRVASRGDCLHRGVLDASSARRSPASPGRR